MRSILLLLCLLLLSVESFAQQRPDSVQIKGEWYFVYPLDEEITPTYSMLKRTDLSDKQFDLLIQWKQAGDSRAKLRKRSLEDSLNAELLRTNVILSKEQSESNWESGTNPPPSYWGGYKLKKKYMRRFPAINVYESDPATYDLIPFVGSLPDGKYIQYFAPFLTYDKSNKKQVISGKVAAVFSLKENLLSGEYTRFNYNGDTVKQGTFVDGIKEGSWFIFLSFDYRKEKSSNTLSTYGTRMFIDLKAGVPEGNYHTIAGKYDETIGQYKNGFAYGTWKIRNDSHTRIYRNIVYGEDWLKDANDILAVISTERAKPAEGFDFSEWKNKTGKPDYYNEFVFKSTIQLVPGAINDFGYLNDDPALGSNLRFQRTSYYEYNNSGKKVLFSGSYETYIDDWMMERITMDPNTHALNYSRYYENGNLFDTMEFHPDDSLFHYRMYDVNGKLYLENTYNVDGSLADKICYATFKIKQPKQVKKPEFKYLEGFPVYVDREHYYKYKTLDYVWQDNNGSVIDGKKYTLIAWDYETKKRRLAEFYIGDTLHELHYNKWGKPAFEIEKVAVKELYKNRMIHVQKAIKYSCYWDNLRWEGVPDTSQHYQIKLYKNDELYSGLLKVRFSRKKVRKSYSGGGNELVLTIPRYYHSRKMNAVFTDQVLFELDERFYHTKQSWGYDDEPSLFNQLASVYFSKHLMNTLNQKEIYGNVTDGIVSGDWTAIGRNGEKTTQLSFSDGLATGTVKHFTTYDKPSRFDRRWKENDRYYYQKFSDKNLHYYIGTEYNLKNGAYHGSYVKKGVNGDTLLRLTYQNGHPNGPLMRTYDGDTLTGNYLNGLPHGDFLYRTSFVGKPDTTMFMQFTNGKLNGSYQLRQDEQFGTLYTLRNDDLSTDAAIRTLKIKMVNDSLTGRMLLYDFDKQPRFGMTFKNMNTDSLFFYENGEVSYYYVKDQTIPVPGVNYTMLDSMTIDPYRKEKIADMLLATAVFLTKNPLNPSTDSYKYWLNGIEDDLEKQKFGFLTKLYPNNKIARTGFRMYNKSIGLWKFYGYEGNLLYTIDYQTNRGNDTIGVYTEYSADGTILSKRYVIEELEKYDCAHSDYYAIRQFIVFEDPKDSIDRSNGLQKNYFDNGVLMSEGNLKNGIPDGVWTFFTPDGRMTIVGKYVNGKKEGRWLYGDLGDKKYIGEICLNPDDPFLDFHIAELEKKKDIQVQIYRNGKAIVSQFHELNKL